MRATEELGSQFPKDYIAFVDTYGSGRVDDFLAIYTPFARRKGTNLFAQIEVERDRFNYIREQGHEDLPYQVWPVDGGLIPVGGDDNGNVVFWRTAGPPDHWSIVVFPARSDAYEEFPTTITQFLTSMLDRTLVVQSFPSDFPNEELHEFTLSSG